MGISCISPNEIGAYESPEKIRLSGDAEHRPGRLQVFVRGPGRDGAREWQISGLYMNTHTQRYGLHSTWIYHDDDDDYYYYDYF